MLLSQELPVECLTRTQGVYLLNSAILAAAALAGLERNAIIPSARYGRYGSQVWICRECPRHRNPVDHCLGQAARKRDSWNRLVRQIPSARRRFAVPVEAIENRHKLGQQQAHEHAADDRDRQRLLGLRANPC